VGLIASTFTFFMTTVLECIEAGTRYLEKRGVEDARRNMQMLVAHRLHCTRTQLYMRFDEALEENSLSFLREDLKKRSERVPLQHLLGTVEFHRREFNIDGRALIPRPETEELIELLLRFLPSPPQLILDMGCGSGIIGLTLAAEWPESQVTLADLSPQALSLARENAGLLALDRVLLVESDLFSAISGPFNLIVANLPYVPEADRHTLSPEVLHDPSMALFSGEDGMDLIRKFCDSAKHFLAPGGMIAMEIGHDQSEQTEDLLRTAGFVDVITHRDLSGIARFPFARMPGSLLVGATA
jgi:release factor glutamine methyltransferase